MTETTIYDAVQSTESPPQPVSPGERRIDKIIIAIHGIGSQRRSDTIRAVARRFGSRSEPPLPVMPLGFFQMGKTGEVHWSWLTTSDDDPLSRIGFAEVFWADIPRRVVKDDDTLEETKAWGASIVSRAQATYGKRVKNPCLTREDFALAGGVIDEIVEAVAVMENLLAVAEKAGVFKFDLAPLLRDYVGDVQIVTEFTFYRDQIVYRFHSAMAQIVSRFQAAHRDVTPDIYIVAHSEGTVVSFLALLQALSSSTVSDPDDATQRISTDWIQYVRGFMTIGSPIDKHIVLWPNLWEPLKPKSQINKETGAVEACRGDGEPGLKLKQRIKWRNYYDFGDPIGFKLDAAAEYLKSTHCEAFEFTTRDHDLGFSRYWLPGKAHNDYWGDAEVFGHFIDDVVLPGKKDPVRPQSKALTGFISTTIPYALSFLLHFIAVFVLYKTAIASPDGVPTPLFAHLALAITLLSILLMSITVAARLPRLVKTNGLRWHVAALLCFLIGAAACWLWLPPTAADLLGRPLAPLVSFLDVPEANVGKAALLLTAAIVAVTSWMVPRKPQWARRFLIGSGMAMILFIVIRRLFMDAEVWPVALGGLAYVYLWWVGILVFDLGFIWHRYVRQSVAIETLSAWNNGNDPPPKVALCLAGRGPRGPKELLSPA